MEGERKTVSVSVCECARKKSERGFHEHLHRLNGCTITEACHELFSEMSPSSNRQIEQNYASTEQMVNMTIKTTELIR